MSSTPDTVECQICGESFDPTASAGYCTNPECGEWQWEAEESESADATETDDTDEIECPHCGTTVPDKDFCLSCGDPLEEEEADEETEAETVDPTCPSCDSDVESDWAACPYCGESLETEAAVDDTDDSTTTETDDADDTTTDDGTTHVPPETVVVEVGDVEITAEDGDSIGRKVRSAYVRNGADEEEAQYIHREHVAFEREGGEFYVVNEGRNGTKLNGEELALDERRSITEGDTIEFSGRATGEISFE